MLPSPRLLLAAATIAAVGLPAPRAHACSHALAARQPFLVVPTDGAADVPINALVRLHWPGGQLFDGGLDASAIHLRTGDGTEVAVTRTVSAPWGAGDVPTVVVRLAPDAPLLPSTSYRLFYDGGQGTPPGEVGSFTTGTATDDVTPDVPDPISLDLSAAHFCTDTEFRCCEQHVVVDASIGLRAPLEPVVYDVFDGFKMIATDRPAPLDGIVFCDEPNGPTFHDTPFAGHPALWMTKGPSVALTLIARDVAGHESVPIITLVQADCRTGGVAIDAGPGGDGAGAAADAAGDKSGGCTVGAGARGVAWLPGVALLAFVLVQVRRRRRS